jgi:hypothetical protein
MDDHAILLARRENAPPEVRRILSWISKGIGFILNGLCLTLPNILVIIDEIASSYSAVARNGLLKTLRLNPLIILVAVLPHRPQTINISMVYKESWVNGAPLSCHKSTNCHVRKSLDGLNCVTKGG